SGVAAIRKKYGKTPPKGSEGYSNTYGAELFLDPGATQINYYQILFNAAGQYTGNYKAIWEQFKPVHTIKSTIRGNRWTVELVYPYKGIRLGDTWGLNFCRNDETYYSLWKDVGYSYHEPKQFGHIVMGDYTQWWSSVSGPGVKAKLGQIAAQVGRPEYKRLHLDSLYAVATTKLRALEALAAKHPPKNRANFELLYRAQASFRADFTRLTDACQTLSLMAPRARASYVVNESFDEWVWRPIKFNMTASGRKVLAAGGKLGYEHRGPLFLLPKFCQAPFGRMVEGADAYRGRSALIVAGPQGSVFGVHGPPGFPVDPRQTYSYSIALKGEGTFNFRAWVQGVNPVTGKVKWLDFPNLATIKVTKKWKVHTGSLKIPPLEKNGFKFKKRVQVALVFSPKSTIYVDDLRIRPGEIKPLHDPPA
ncbi:MAG: hypothetical protein QGG25_05720, partial [Phycisphaerae bacterium]|nr:hypothetical protein [Phycisphaerae bacterium]